jgi:hypothetical protein
MRGTAFAFNKPFAGTNLTRRSFLSLSGALTLGVTTTSGGSVPDTSLNSFKLIHNEKRAVFLIKGREQWVIDTSLFGGEPILKVRQNEKSVHLQLINANYPGTNLTADFVCDITQSPTSWKMNLRLGLGVMITDVPFEDWLLKKIPAISIINIPQAINTDFGRGHLSFEGIGQASFDPGWMLRISGNKAARLTAGADLDIFCDSVIINLLGANDHSLSSDPSPRRSLITLNRESNKWHFKLPENPAAESIVTINEDVFDVLHIEAGEDSGRSKSHLFLAEAINEDKSIEFRPDKDIAGFGDAPLSIALRQARYAFSLEHKGSEAALIANYFGEAGWVNLGSCAFYIGQSEDDSAQTAQSFQLIFDENKIKSLNFAPRLKKISLPMPGAAVSSPNFAENTQLAFTLGAEQDTPPAKEQIRLNLDRNKKQNWVELPLTSVDILRPEDLLALRFEFINLVLRTRKKKRNFFEILTFKDPKYESHLVRRNVNKPAYIVVHFPQQHIAEEAFFEAADPALSDIPSKPPVKSRLSKPSRLAFQIPDNIPLIHYTLEALLDWTKFKQSVAPTALPPEETTSERLQEPEDSETAIEFPYRLILSPNERAAWAHSLLPVSQTNDSSETPGQQTPNDKSEKIQWTELWHTRLAVRLSDNEIDETNEYFRTLRAIWSPDLGGGNAAPDPCNPGKKPNDPNSAFRMAMDARDRYEIVQLSANFTDFQELDENNQPVPYRPLPVKAQRFMLTSLGAWADLEGAWPTVNFRGQSQSLSVKAWRHLVGMARDQYVRIVYGGYLYPFGHPASLVQVTERKFERPEPNGPVIAYLRQRIYVTVEDPVKTYGNSGLTLDGRKSVDRMMPYRTLKITNLTSPNLDRPESSDIGGAGKCAFWPRVGGRDFLFHLVGTDVAGQPSELNAPAIFVAYVKRHDQVLLEAVKAAYRNSGAGRREMNGQTVAFVPPRQSGDTNYETQILNFDGHLAPPGTISLVSLSPALIAPPQDSCELPLDPEPAPWQAILTDAVIKIPAVEKIIGAAKDLPIVWNDTYLEKGFDLSLPAANIGEVFADIRETLRLSLPESRSVGLIKPDFDISALSRKFGSIGGDIDSLITGTFKPTELFPRNVAKILGIIDLIDVLKSTMTFESEGGGEKVPKVITRTIFDDVGLPEKQESRMQWFPELKEWDGGFVKFKLLPEHALSLEILIITNLREGGATTYELSCALQNFQINIIDAIDINFNRLSFLSRNGQKPDVDVDIGNVGFGAALQIINKLSELLSKSLFGEQGPTILLTESSITASVSIPIPTIAVGVFTLQNIRLSTRLFLPFKGDTPVRLRFAFSERHDPFLVSVTLLGGGGFVAVTLGLDGIEIFEAAIEAGGILTIDIGVAKGSAYALVGIYLVYERGSGVKLSGYQRCGGMLRILGIITISVEFWMGLTYEFDTGIIRGEAKVTVRIEILFFSKEVELRLVREWRTRDRRFLRSVQDGTDEGAPSFEELMSPEAWDMYCDAFASSESECISYESRS